MKIKNKFRQNLYPAPIDIKDFKNSIRNLKNSIENNKDVYLSMKEMEDIPYYFKKNGEYIDTKIPMPAIKDIGSLYVLIDYLNSKNKNKFLVRSSYMTFLQEQWNDIKEFLYSMIKKSETYLFKDIEVDIVKGSIYKIKKYFLENNKIKDIRGASTILDYLNVEATYKYLHEKYIPQCSIYCGGGNVFLIVPKGEGQKVSMELEELYSKTSLTAKNAFDFVTYSLNELVLNYNDISRKVNAKLEERKKLKLYLMNPDFRVDKLTMGKTKISFEYKTAKYKKICKLCGIRDSKYKTYTGGGEIHVCPSCLRKNTVGRNKTKFYDEYEKFTNTVMNKKHKIQNIEDIKDENGDIAVIYADGNNMGNVIMNIENPFEHMYFSRKLDNITKGSVYSSLYETMGENAIFEAIAIGGDDVLLIVPANRSLEIVSKIIDKFDKAYDYNMTISAGVCIAKYNTPIRNMFDISSASIKNAKKLVRSYENDKKKGTIDVVILEGNSNVDLKMRKDGLFPLNNTDLKNTMEIINKMKKDSKNIKKTQIHKLRYAAERMDKQEFQLFYSYQESRTTRKYTNYVKEIFKNDHKFISGLIEKKDAKNRKIIVSPWNDISILWDYTGDDSNDRS